MVNSPLQGQTIYVDANTLIYALETPKLFPGLRRHFVNPFLRGELPIVTSWITLSEVLVKPMQSGDTRLEAYYRQLIQPSTVCSVIPVAEGIASAAASIRAQFGVRLPDAIHIATGQSAGCSCLLTMDAAWAKASISTVDPASLS
jgi:predicted nucleic acid-binding protein